MQTVKISANGDSASISLSSRLNRISISATTWGSSTTADLMYSPDNGVSVPWAKVFKGGTAVSGGASTDGAADMPGGGFVMTRVANYSGSSEITLAAVDARTEATDG